MKEKHVATTADIVRAIANSDAPETRVLLNVIESAYDGIFVVDGECKVLYVNKAYEAMSGRGREEFVGRYMQELMDSGVMNKYISADVIKKRKPVTVRETLVSGRSVMVTGTPVFDETGGVVAVISNVRDISEIIRLQQSAEISEGLADIYRREMLEGTEESDIVCESREMLEILNFASKVARRDSTVLLTGETGVGKELFARYIHLKSRRRDNNYIKINCGAIPKNLIESELFGYVKGAFTGASDKGKIGLFELANDGTLFLDEIGELPFDVQASLLRALQDGEITRIGEGKSRKVNARIIAATNRDLVKMVREGRFRSDLYYRLNVISIDIPPLREHPEDIPKLAEHFVRKLNAKYGEDKVITHSFKEKLTKIDWPGNIREFANFIERQYIMQDGEVLDDIIIMGPYDLSFGVSGEGTAPAAGTARSGKDGDGELPKLDDAVAALEKDLVMRAMEKGRSTVKAARLLGVSQPTFSRKYAKYRDEKETGTV